MSNREKQTKDLMQKLQRKSHIKSISSKKINVPTVNASTNKIKSIRYLHGIQNSYVNFVETPEGHKVGIVNNLKYSSA